MPRILLITHGFPPESLGGVEQHVDGLAQALGAAGHEVTVLARSAAPDAPDAPQGTLLPPVAIAKGVLLQRLVYSLARSRRIWGPLQDPGLGGCRRRVAALAAEPVRLGPCPSLDRAVHRTSPGAQAAARDSHRAHAARLLDALPSRADVRGGRVGLSVGGTVTVRGMLRAHVSRVARSLPSCGWTSPTAGASRRSGRPRSRTEPSRRGCRRAGHS